MINGAHAILYSKDADADRDFMRDVLGFPSVDGGDGFLIFGLPKAELGIHPAETGGSHELFLTCDDIEAFRRRMTGRNVPVSDVSDEGWGLLVSVTLPSGHSLGVYEPRHPRPR